MIEPYVMEHHAPVKVGWFSALVCRKCWLVYLKNPLTAWCQKHGCNYADHPNYKAAIRKFTRPSWIG